MMLKKQTAVTIDAVGRGFGRVERELENWQVDRISKVSSFPQAP